VRSLIRGECREDPERPLRVQPAKPGRMHACGRGELPLKRRRPDERGAAVPGRDGALGGRAIRTRHQIAAIVVQVTPNGNPPTLSVVHVRPFALSCVTVPRLSCSPAGSSALNVSTSFESEPSMAAGSFARATITHVGPLAENPCSANAASVPIAAARLPTKPAPSVSSSFDRSLLKAGCWFDINVVNSWNS